MADYRAVIRHFPPVRDYIRNRKWVKRGEVVAYAPDLRSDHFSTDRFGFRRTRFQSRHWDLADCLASKRYGIVMGSSHVFGFGLPSDGDTFASRLSAAMGFPFMTIAFPEADTRSLHAVLLNILSSDATRPAAIVLTTGGDMTRFCYTCVADHLFGSPNILDNEAVGRAQSAMSDIDAPFEAMLASSRLWTRAVVDLARSASVPIILGDDTTFMEIVEPDAVERDCKLAESGGPDQLRRFALQRLYGERFYRMRREIENNLDVRLIGPAKDAGVGFIDEFHYRADSIDQFSQLLAEAINREL